MEVEKRNTEKLLTAQAVGEMLSLSKRQVFRLNSCGKIPASIRVGGSVRWSESEMLDFIKAKIEARKKNQHSEGKAPPAPASRYIGMNYSRIDEC